MGAGGGGGDMSLPPTVLMFILYSFSMDECKRCQLLQAEEVNLALCLPCSGGSLRRLAALPQVDEVPGPLPRLFTERYLEEEDASPPVPEKEKSQDLVDSRHCSDRNSRYGFAVADGD